MVRTRHSIYCNDCQKVIGVIDIIGSGDEERVKYIQQDGLISARRRSDGHWGFECVNCGLYTIVAPEEVEDVIQQSRPDVPTAFMLRSVVARRNTVVNRLKRGVEVDGFRMTEVRI